MHAELTLPELQELRHQGEVFRPAAQPPGDVIVSPVAAGDQFDDFDEDDFDDEFDDDFEEDWEDEFAEDEADEADEEEDFDEDLSLVEDDGDGFEEESEDES